MGALEEDDSVPEELLLSTGLLLLDKGSPAPLTLLEDESPSEFELEPAVVVPEEELSSVARLLEELFLESSSSSASSGKFNEHETSASAPSKRSKEKSVFVTNSPAEKQDSDARNIHSRQRQVNF
jgi:hypothetical protein